MKLEAPEAHDKLDSVVFAEREDHVNCPYCRVEQHPMVVDPKGGDYQCDECDGVYRVAPKPVS